ncbi:MAG: hypothetical protein JSV36_07545 [Anaerolineae bacterium]|nr:MAG: hypothetical protein JSV36_07545 [Anaerolineae bacterium]
MKMSPAITRTLKILLIAATFWMGRPDVWAKAQAPQNLLTDPNFEDGFYYADGQPELQVANGWKPWWIEGTREETSRGYLHRPEYKAEDRLLYGGRRIRSERYGQKFFTSFSTHHAGFFQRAAAPTGSQVTFCIWVQVWSSSKHDPDRSQDPGKVRV